jgi:hypothetical protein
MTKAITWERAVELGKTGLAHGFKIKPGVLGIMGDHRCFFVDAGGRTFWVDELGDSFWEQPMTKLPDDCLSLIPDFRDHATLGLLLLQVREEGVSSVLEQILETVTKES